MTGWIGISLGDICGIGPEVTLKALATEISQDKTRYLIIGDVDHIRGLNQRLGLHLDLQPEQPRSSPGNDLQQPGAPAPTDGPGGRR